MIYQRVCACFLVACLSSAVFAETPLDVDSRVQALEKTVQEQQTTTKAEADLLKKQTEADTAILKKQLEQYLFFRDWEARLILAVLGFILGGSAGILWTRSKISEVVQQQSKEIEEKIKADFANGQAQLGQTLKRLVHAEAQTIESTFAKTRLEEQFKQESRILIITDQQDNKLETDFERLGFNAGKIKRAQFNLAFHGEPKRIVIPEHDYDLIVLDSLKNQDLLDYIKAGTQLAYLVYYEGSYQPFPDRQRSNIANSKLTLYPRALEVLLYKHAQRI